jgi:hypothetical protein
MTIPPDACDADPAAGVVAEAAVPVVVDELHAPRRTDTAAAAAITDGFIPR